MDHGMRKKGEPALASIIQAYASLPHLPWEQIVPAIPFATQAASNVGSRVAERTIKPVAKDVAGYSRTMGRRALRHVFALPPPGVQPYKPLRGLRKLVFKLLTKRGSVVRLEELVKASAFLDSMRRYEEKL